MKGLVQLTWNEIKMNIRDPLSIFWSLAFPALWLTFNAMIFKVPIPGSGYQGLNYASFLIPGCIGLVIVSAAFIGVPMTLSNYRETAMLRRLRVTPVKTWILVTAFSISTFIFILLGILLLLLVGKLFFQIQILGSWLMFAGLILIGMITFLAIGGAIGSIAPSFRTANIIIWSVFTPMLMLSELFLPIAILPAWMRPVAYALPLTPINTMLRDVVYGVPMDDLWRFGILAVWILISGFLIVKFFRWE